MESIFTLFWKSFFLGFIVAIPVGPVALLLIQRSLSVNHIAGMATGIGAALADGFFGFLAAFGLVALMDQIELARHLFRPLGSIALLLVGLHFYFQKPPPLVAKEVLTGPYQRRYWWDAISAFFVTLLNPATIIAFAALFAGSDLIPIDPKKIQMVDIAAGVFFGSLTWWMILSWIAGPVKRHLNPHEVHRFLQGLGGVLMGLALISLVPQIGHVIDTIKKLVGK